MIKGLIIDWLINQAIAALLRWLDQNQPTANIQKRERPAPIVKPKVRPKYQSIPGFDRNSGTWR